MNRFAVLVVGALACLQGCAGADATEDGPASETAALTAHTQASDADIKAKLTSILRDVTFMSESDYPDLVLEAEGGGAKKLTSKTVRTKLAAMVKENASSQRDITKRTCRAEKLTLADVLADANLTDPEERDARQAGLAVKYMTEQLRGVVGYTFGTNASGDQDEEGPVVYVYVGISRTTGKLIAIMTEAVYT